MAEHYSSSSRTAPSHRTPRPDRAGVDTTPDTAEDAPKGKVGVYDRLGRSFSSWSPMTLIALILGVILLLWVLGIFKQILG